MDNDDKILLMVGALAVALAFGMFLSYHLTDGKVRREAVKAGVARYVADEEGGVKFEWITPAEKKP